MAPADSYHHSKKSNTSAYTQSSSFSSSTKQGGGRQQKPTALPAFNPRKIFVGGLPQETNDEHLRGLFRKYGSVADAVVLFHPDGRHRGFGYVTFSQVESALHALADKPNHHILAQEVDAKRAVPGTNKLFVGGLHQLVTDADLRTCFSAFGEVADAYVLPDVVNGRSRGFGFVSYMPGTEGAKAVAKATEKQWLWLRGKKIEAKLAKTPHQMATEAGKAGQVTAQPKTTPEEAALPAFCSSSSSSSSSSVAGGCASVPLPPGLFDAPGTTLVANEASKIQQSFLSATKPGVVEKKHSDEAAGSPSTSSTTTPTDSPKLLKPLLALTPEAAATSPSFGDSPKWLTFKTAPVGFWQHLDCSDAGLDAGVDGLSRWPYSSNQRSLAHLGPPPGIFKKADAMMEKTKSQMPKHGPMLLGFEKLATIKKAAKPSPSDESSAQDK